MAYILPFLPFFLLVGIGQARPSLREKPKILFKISGKKMNFKRLKEVKPDC